MKPNKLLLTIAAFALLYFGTKWKHRFDRPWAYASDQPLLLGKWEGKFRDPDGIEKHMIMTIDEPEQEKRDYGHEYRRFNEAQIFDGHATITSRLGTENDRVEGGLGSKDGHAIEQISFTPMDESKTVRESFNVTLTEPGGKWEDDVITVTLIFVYRTKTGSGYSDSGDPRFKKTVPLVLRRVVE